MKIMTLRASAAALALIAPTAASAQNIVLNTSFETQANGTVANWTLNGGPNGGLSGFISGSYAHSGQGLLVGSCGGAGSTATLDQPCYADQVLNTVAGQTYDLSLWLRQYAGSTPGTGGFSVFFGGQQITNQTFAPADFGYTQFIFTGLVATGTSTDLQIHLRQDLGQLFLDDVSVTASGPVTPAVPEPASWALMITGFGLVGAAMRRRATTVRFA